MVARKAFLALLLTLCVLSFAVAGYGVIYLVALPSARSEASPILGIELLAGGGLGGLWWLGVHYAAKTLFALDDKVDRVLELLEDEGEEEEAK